MRLVSTFQKVLPIRDVYLEVGSFDTQILEQRKRAFQFLKDRTISMESVTVLQRFVKRYFIVTAINASWAKESKTVGFSVYTTSATGNTIDHTDRMGNLITVCTKCHTQTTKKAGSYLVEPKIKPLTVGVYEHRGWKIVQLSKTWIPI